MPEIKSKIIITLDYYPTIFRYSHMYIRCIHNFVTVVIKEI